MTDSSTTARATKNGTTEDHSGVAPGHGNPRVIAFYLPQYHPIPENDEWWGKGFTEWTQVAAARPLFKGHHQPQLPGELGFYDLRVPEVREQQASLAREYGIEGFCYWHYWLGNGRRLLERPFQEVLDSGKPDFPFCLAWGNHDWSGTCFGAGKRVLARQFYPGLEDHEAHFRLLRRAFADDRYIQVHGKPLFYILRPHEIPDCKNVMEFYRDQAVKAGFKGLYLVAHSDGMLQKQAEERFGLDAVHISRHREISFRKPRNYGRVTRAIRRKLSPLRPSQESNTSPLQRYSYAEAMTYVLLDHYGSGEFPSIITNWDTTPRFGRDAVIFEDATPTAFRSHAREALKKIESHKPDEKIVFLRAWNEWAEGNYLEPDEKYGRQRLIALREEIQVAAARSS